MKYSFYLGGHDLEMLEIRKILLSLGYVEGENLFDKNLKWGAKLSDYVSDFKADKINVCIELTEDIAPPENYLRVDHHNENAGLPASIEQVAQLLKINLTREQKLIAENDKNYIPAMKNFGASDEEIADIRRRDRAAQGSTDEDEVLGLRSIDKNLREISPRSFVIKSLTHRFSTITDRLYGTYDNLLIYTDTELTYYGNNKDELLKKIAKFVPENKIYSGKAYFGIGAGSLGEKEFKKILNTIRKYLK